MNGPLSVRATFTAQVVVAPVPDAPTGLAATAVSRSQINLSWKDNSSDEANFRIERSTNGKSFSAIATVGANVTTFSNSGLKANTTYYYRVSAVNSSGASVYSNTVLLKTPR
jgi:predicted phage tail protein